VAQYNTPSDTDLTKQLKKAQAEIKRLHRATRLQSSSVGLGGGDIATIVGLANDQVRVEVREGSANDFAFDTGMADPELQPNETFTLPEGFSRIIVFVTGNVWWADPNPGASRANVGNGYAGLSGYAPDISNPQTSVSGSFTNAVGTDSTTINMNVYADLGGIMILNWQMIALYIRS
jgi:hypothetical protein